VKNRDQSYRPRRHLNSLWINRCQNVFSWKYLRLLPWKQQQL